MTENQTISKRLTINADDLRHPDGVSEPMCHAGTVGWRERDYAALLDPRIGACIEELGIEFVGCGGVARQ